MTSQGIGESAEPTIGILPLARATFDVAFAKEKFAAVLDSLHQAPAIIVGSESLLFDGAAAQEAIADLKSAGIDRLLILQITFTDAAITVEAAKSLGVPVAVWAVPEPRLGERLRLNAFCGLNLASHALGLNDIPFSWAYGDAGDIDLDGLLSGERTVQPRFGAAAPLSSDPAADATVEKLRGKRIARLGAHPEGFDTCRYDAKALEALSGVAVDAKEIDDLFTAAKALPVGAEHSLREELDGTVAGFTNVDADELSRSLRLKLALDGLRASGQYDAFAIRCWPETFTEYGGAVCGPVSLLGGARVPCACEADVYGAVTQLILQDVAQAPVFLTDMVDVDTNDDTVVVWHCGQAPLEMAADPKAIDATLHTNRKMPLLMEFPLKPGRITMMRLSQAHGRTQMIVSTGQALDRPMAFTGTSGVVRFDNGAQAWMEGVFASGLEHHMALAYGDHRDALVRVAAALDIPVLDL
ncbi:MAG: hypothetical protein AAGM04_10295 [Pseudomonadota bacterium]